MRNTYNLKDGRVIQLIQDEDAMNPRTEWDNLGTMVCFHKRYTLGDEKHGYNDDDYSGWDELKAAIIRAENVAVILPIYMYDHSGITIRTTPFSCRWDSGQIGFIFISKAKVRKEYSKKRISKQLRDKITTYLIGEVETYDQYLTGDTYGFKTYANAEAFEAEQEEDSCWGFFGHNILENGILDHVGAKAEDLIDA